MRRGGTRSAVLSSRKEERAPYWVSSFKRRSIGPEEKGKKKKESRRKTKKDDFALNPKP